MTYNPAIHHRRSIRLKGYDYSQAGWYFITISTHERLHLFGEVINGEMILNNIGKIVSDCWLDSPKHYENIVLDEFLIMPNHFHGIVIFTNTVGVIGSGDMVETGNEVDNVWDTVGVNSIGVNSVGVNSVGAIHESPLHHESTIHHKTRQQRNPSQQPPPMDIKQRRKMRLSKLIGRFKMVSSKQINIIRNTSGVPVWQLNYYEHIIRNEPDLKRIQEYIVNNPVNWQKDNYHVQKNYRIRY